MHESHGAIGKLQPHKKITIIGGGISGLFVGFYLKKYGIEFELFEKEKILGGKIGTKENSFGISETAANAVFSNDEVFELLEELKLDFIPTAKKLKKMVWRNSKLASPPITLWEILKILPNLFKAPVVTEQTSVFNFFSPLLGEKVTADVLAPVFGGVYAENIKDLHFTSIFKSWNKQASYLKFIISIIKQKKQQKQKSQSISFPNGMQELISSLHSYMKDEIKTDFTIEDLSRENTLICTHAHHAADIMRSSHPEISAELDKIKYNQLSSATLITSEQIPFLSGAFGVLFPPVQNEFNSLGILANSEIFPKRTLAPGLHSYTFILKSSDGEEDQVESDLKIMKAQKSFSQRKSVTITHWKTALPIYNYNRHQSILKLRSQFLQIEPGVCLFGNYVDGISLREILVHAKNLALSMK